MNAKQKDAPQVVEKPAALQEKLGWNEVPLGAVIAEAGNGVQYQTGDWRSARPVVNVEKCIHCLFCWVYCPDGAVVVENEKFKAIDYYHCKGCGICSAECPAKVITMVEESAFQAQESAAIGANGNAAHRAERKGG